MATYYKWRKSNYKYVEEISSGYNPEAALPEHSNNEIKIYYSSSINVNSGSVQLVSPITKHLTRNVKWTLQGGYYFQFEGQSSIYKAETGGAQFDWKLTSWTYCYTGPVSLVRVASSPTSLVGYVYSISASAYPNGGVSGSYYYDQRTTVTSPTNPGSITVPESIKGGETITISWTAASGVAAGVSGYEVERSTNGGSSWAQIYRGSSRSTTNLVEKGTPSVMYRVRAYDSNGQYSAYTTSPNRTVINNEPPSAPASISVTPPVAGESATITITAATDPDGTIASYQYERSIDGNGWTQISNVNELSYTDTVDAEWATVAYRVRAVDDEGASGPYVTSETFTVNSGWLVISGPAEDMGEKPGPFVFAVSAGIPGSTGATDIDMTVTLDGLEVYSGTVSDADTVKVDMDTRLMGEGEHTIAVSVSKEDYLPTSRAYVFNVPSITLPDGGRMVQFENQAGSPVFPVTLARGVIGKNGRSIEDIVEELEVSGTFGANIVTGTYQGSGTFGSTSPNLLALAFAPKVLLLFDNKGAMTVIVPFIGKYSPRLGTSGAGTVTTEGTSVTWYAANAADQMNSSGVTYTYVAIG